MVDREHLRDMGSNTQSLVPFEKMYVVANRGGCEQIIVPASGHTEYVPRA